MNGHHTHTYSNGDTYHGDFKDNKRHGRGKNTWADGTTYDGEWKDDHWHGRGVRIFGPRRSSPGQRGEQYEGEWQNGKRHGRGKNTWADGTTYDGEWKDDNRHGRGHSVSTSADGSIISAGEWKDDEQLPSLKGSDKWVAGETTYTFTKRVRAGDGTVEGNQLWEAEREDASSTKTVMMKVYPRASSSKGEGHGARSKGGSLEARMRRTVRALGDCAGSIEHLGFVLAPPPIVPDAAGASASAVADMGVQWALAMCKAPHDLTSYLDELRTTTKLDTDQKHDQRHIVARRAIVALHKVHQRGLAHLDIKPSNMLVDTVAGATVVTLCDWDSAVPLAPAPETGVTADATYPCSSTGAVKMSVRYAAPEVVAAAREGTGASLKATQAMDVFSLGLVLAEVFSTAGLASCFRTDEEAQEAHASGDVAGWLDARDRISCNGRTHAKALVVRLLAMDPLKRLKLSEVLTSDYIAGRTKLADRGSLMDHTAALHAGTRVVVRGEGAHTRTAVARAEEARAASPPAPPAASASGSGSGHGSGV